MIYLLLAGIILSEYIQLISDRGSFLESIWGRSKCDACGKEVPWYALIPIFGRFIAKERCPYCGKKISRKYLWFELIFIAGWIASVYLLYMYFTVTWLIAAAFLLLYCTSALIMYEDFQKYSVPVSWLSSWVAIFVGFWLLIGNRHVYLLDTALMLGVLALSIGVVALRKTGEERQLKNLFGSADVIVLLLYSLLLGFQTTTWALLLTMVCAFLFLVFEKRLKVGQRLPLLTMMIPWGVLALLIL